MGNLDGSFSDDGVIEDYGGSDASTVIIQSDRKIVAAGSAGVDYPGISASYFALIRYNYDGTRDNSFNNNQQATISGAIKKVIISNNKLYAVGNGHSLGNVGIVARYLLDNETTTPTVSLTIPYNIVKYTAPARIKLNAAVANVSGTITKVRFYNGTTLLHTDTESPYGFLWVNVPAGNYTLTAKAYDDKGGIITSNVIIVSVVDENVPPVVSIISPVDHTTYTGPATIRLIANAKDPIDRISKVEFYNGTTLLRTEYYYPYTYTWTNVQPGTYTITAKAYDDKGLSATSAPVTVTVTNAAIVSRPSSENSKTDLNGGLSLKLSPVPAGSTLQIYTKGLQQNKPSTISVLSASGVVLKTIQSNASDKVVQLDVSSLASGMYTIKVVSGVKLLYKQFVKL
ncbi:MAG: Ig-like domain-containing protein [Segetibacter sp.]